MADSIIGSISGVTGTGSLGQLVSTYFQQKAEARLFQNLVWYNLGQKRNIPKNSGQLTQFYRYGNIYGSTSTVATNATIATTSAQAALTATTVSLTTLMYGQFVTLAKFDVDSIRSKSLVEDAVDVLADAASDTVDLLIRSTIYSNTATTGAGTLTASLYYGQDLSKTTASITTADTMNAGTIRKMVRNLQSNKVRPFTDGQKYGLVIHPAQLYDLVSDTTVGGFLASAQYSQAEKIWNGEVGSIMGARILISQTALSASADITSSVTNAYYAAVVGEDAFATVALDNSPIQVITKSEGGTYDPFGNLVTVAYKLPQFGVAWLGADGPRAIRIGTSASA